MQVNRQGTYFYFTEGQGSVVAHLVGPVLDETVTLKPGQGVRCGQPFTVVTIVSQVDQDALFDATIQELVDNRGQQFITDIVPPRYFSTRDFVSTGTWQEVSFPEDGNIRSRTFSASDTNAGFVLVRDFSQADYGSEYTANARKLNPGDEITVDAWAKVFLVFQASGDTVTVSSTSAVVQVLPDPPESMA